MPSPLVHPAPAQLQALSGPALALAWKLDPTRLPRHLAITMDGNGRWALNRHLPRIAGHRAGAEAVRRTVETCARLGLPALTLYAFSTENWKRPQSEVSFLMRLLQRYLRSEVAELRQQNIRLEAIGRLGDLPEPVRERLERAREATARQTGMRLTLALNYGGRAEIADACQTLVREARASGRLDQLQITEAALQSRLYQPSLPELDLLIRTSGEMRVSNFLLWQLAYAEIWVTPVLWPDFGQADLIAALREYQSRERRFGGLREASSPA